MSTAVFGVPISDDLGEQVSISTTAVHSLFQPGYEEVLLYCPSAFRMRLAPRLASVKVFSGSAYTDYTAQATDRVATTHVPLDGMTTAKFLYLGFKGNTRGAYINVDGTNKNAEAASSLAGSYCYDCATVGYMKLTGTVTAALTVGETITGSVSGATGVAVYDDASTYLIVKTITGKFAIGENAAGATQACNTITAIDPVAWGTPYFKTISITDGTSSGGVTLAIDGLIYWTLPTDIIKASISGVDSTPLYWYRFAPNKTLSATIDLVDIIPAAPSTAYGYYQAGQSYQFAPNIDKCGAFELYHATSDTLNVTWIAH